MYDGTVKNEDSGTHIGEGFALRARFKIGISSTRTRLAYCRSAWNMESMEQNVKKGVRTSNYISFGWRCYLFEVYH